ncbi:MAG: toll/interleukin-1 receptor domain-containing protein [Eubacterium sp.]|nr:toll/interleukin-1 receptor domain-containing protein [Eubacterium sp.]
MGNNILFLSHSSKDAAIVASFVNFMCKIGIKNTDIVCSSVSSTKLPASVNIFEHLSNLIADEKIYVIYFLSDNYYSSPVCLNEMGAVWLKKSDSLSLLLSGFDFKDIQGVIDKDKVAIKLGNCDNMTKALLNDFKVTLENLYNINIDNNCWELARDEFLKSTIEDVRIFNMLFSRSYCKGISCVDVEVRLNNVDRLYEIGLDDDEKNYKIPLMLFCEKLSFWKMVSEIKFVFHRKK